MSQEPAEIKVQDLHLLFHPGFYNREEATKIQSQLEDLTYNSDEDSKVMMFGEMIKIPRKQVAFSDPGISYRFAGADVPGRPWPEFMIPIRDRMDAYLREQGILDKESPDHINYVLVNLYRDGHDYIGAHSDDEPGMTKIKTATGEEETIIISLSFGVSRDFVFQRKDNTAVKHNLVLQHGDLLIMRGTTNDKWKHALPKRTTITRPRYNLTFRFMRPVPKKVNRASKK